MEDWDFEDNEHWTSPNPESLMFDGVLDGERFVFAISQMAMNDLYGTPDTPNNAIDNYLDHSLHIEGIARRFASGIERNKDSPHFFVNSGEFKRLA